jgi:hypothetical protein
MGTSSKIKSGHTSNRGSPRKGGNKDGDESDELGDVAQLQPTTPKRKKTPIQSPEGQPARKMTPTLARCSKTNKNVPCIYIIAPLVTGLELLIVQKGQGDDAYIWPLVSSINNEDDEAPGSDLLSEQGITNCFARRKNTTSNEAATQASNPKFFRRVFLRLVPDGGPSTPETRQEFMETIQKVSCAVVNKGVCRLLHVCVVSS